jgi:RNA polymerase sigma-70 factor (ECF subfamily)
MVRFAEGERSAFDPLFAELWPILRSYVGRSLSDADADDATQNAIVKVFDRIADFNTARDGVTWALAITSYEIMTMRRRRLRGREAPLSDDRADFDLASPHEQAEWHEQLRILGELLEASSETDRAAIEAELRGEVAHGEAARKRRFRALSRLRDLWRKSHA